LSECFAENLLSQINIINIKLVAQYCKKFLVDNLFLSEVPWTCPGTESSIW